MEASLSSQLLNARLAAKWGQETTLPQCSAVSAKLAKGRWEDSKEEIPAGKNCAGPVFPISGVPEHAHEP